MKTPVLKIVFCLILFTAAQTWSIDFANIRQVNGLVLPPSYQQSNGYYLVADANLKTLDLGRSNNAFIQTQVEFEPAAPLEKVCDNIFPLNQVIDLKGLETIEVTDQLNELMDERRRKEDALDPQDPDWFKKFKIIQDEYDVQNGILLNRFYKICDELKLLNEQRDTLWIETAGRATVPFKFHDRRVLSDLIFSNPDLNFVSILTPLSGLRLKQGSILTDHRSSGYVSEISLNGYEIQDTDSMVPLEGNPNEVILKYALTKKLLCSVAKSSGELPFKSAEEIKEIYLINMHAVLDEETERKIEEALLLTTP